MEKVGQQENEIQTNKSNQKQAGHIVICKHVCVHQAWLQVCVSVFFLLFTHKGLQVKTPSNIFPLGSRLGLPCCGRPLH